MGNSTEGDDVTDLYGGGIHDDAVDQEFDDRSPLLEGDLLQPPCQGRTEFLRSCGEHVEVLVLYFIGTALLLFPAQGGEALLERGPPAAELVERQGLRRGRVDQPL